MILEKTKIFMFNFVEIFKVALGNIQEIVNKNGVLKEAINIVFYILIFIFIITIIFNIIKNILD